MPREAAKRHWMVTSYEDDFDARVSVDGVCHPLLTYAVGQQESCPTTSRTHWQVYVTFKDRVRLSSVKRLLGDSVHAEACEGTPLECKTYCTKEESRLDGGRSFEFGTFPGREQTAASVVLDEACGMLRDGRTLSDIAEAYPACFVRNNRGLNAYAKAIRPRPPPEYRPVTVWILWGDAGAGKTRAVFDWLRRSGKAFHRKSYTRGQPSWWDGYTDQEVLLLDDFEGDRCGCAVEEFLNLTDGYGHTRSWPVKGDFAYLDNVKTIFITSNTDPSTWYSMMPEKAAAVARRCTNVHHVRTGVEWFNIPLPDILAHVSTPVRSDSRSPEARRRLAFDDVSPVPLVPAPLARTQSIHPWQSLGLDDLSLPHPDPQPASFFSLSFDD